jgi:hypothetical protein
MVMSVVSIVRSLRRVAKVAGAVSKKSTSKTESPSVASPNVLGRRMSGSKPGSKPHKKATMESLNHRIMALGVACAVLLMFNVVRGAV